MIAEINPTPRPVDVDPKKGHKKPQDNYKNALGGSIGPKR
jgi:hypothetical protein